MKKPMLITAALILGLALASQANAACYADYKAKKAAPLQLHYGVIALPDRVCGNRAKIRKTVAKRIRVGGWKLLNVMSVFGEQGLSQRQQSAGRFYLKY